MKVLKNLTIFLVFFSFIFLLQAHPSYAWLSGWNYRRAITINNTANSNALTDYQVAINLTYSSNFGCPDFSCIRFTNSSDNLLSYWIESKVDGSWAYVWVKVPSIPASSTATIYLYYGNTTPVSSASNGTATFILFSDFENGNTNGWYCTQATISTTTSNVFHGSYSATVSITGADGWCYLNQSLNLNWFKWHGAIKRTDMTTDNGYGRICTDSACAAIQSAFVTWKDGIVKKWDNNAWVNFAQSSTNWAKFNITYNATALNKITWNATLGNSVTAIYNNNVPSGRYGFAIYGYGGTMMIDDWFVAKYTDPEPTYSIGAEEGGNQPPSITIYSPTNTTYWYANNFQFSFKATDDSSATFQLKAFLDGNSVYDSSSYQSNTQINLTQNLNLPKQYNFTVWANDTQGATSSLTVIFTIKDFEIQQIAFNSIVYETTTQSFTETIRANFDLVSNITANLFWNSTDKGSCSQSMNSTHIILSQAIDIPLVQANNTAINFFFRNYITYTNTSSSTVDSEEEIDCCVVRLN